MVYEYQSFTKIMHSRAQTNIGAPFWSTNEYRVDGEVRAYLGALFFVVYVVYSGRKIVSIKCWFSGAARRKDRTPSDTLKERVPKRIKGRGEIYQVRGYPTCRV
jgi:hypothetical protein